jgi:hypothetical protein
MLAVHRYLRTNEVRKKTIEGYHIPRNNGASKDIHIKKT